jgi:large conductance mechanosensitive channel
MNSIVKEFKEFALRGNVLDLAVGVVIGGAFGGIVNSLVNDIITPAILTPVLNAAHLKNLSELTIKGTAIKYGNFISSCISFIIIAFALFLVIKAVNIAQKKLIEQTPPPAPLAPSAEEKLLIEIRDILKNK